MHGLYLLWWVQEKHVPAPIVAAILAGGEMAITLLELPTGWLADRYGHRASLIAGSCIQAAGMAACWIGDGAAGILAASFLVALGDAFRSGADQALLYRSCRAIEREHDFQSIEARAQALETAALVGLTLVGWLIVRTFGFNAGWFAETTVSVIGAVVACAMVEPPPALPALPASPARPVLPARPARPARLLIPLLAAIVPVSLLNGAAAAAFFLLQTGRDAEAAGVTLIVAVITLAEATGSALAARMPSSLRVLGLLSIAGAVLAIGGFARPGFLPAGAVVVSVILGAALPLRSVVVQRLTADTTRAQAASLASAIDKVMTTLALLAAGISRR